MARTLFAGMLGLLAPVVDSGAEEFFPTLAGSEAFPAAWLIVGLYMGLAQYLVARKGLGFQGTLPTVIAMSAPLLILVFALGQIELALCCLLGILIGARVASMV